MTVTSAAALPRAGSDAPIRQSGRIARRITGKRALQRCFISNNPLLKKAPDDLSGAFSPRECEDRR